MRFVLLPLVSGESIGINVAEVSVICPVKKGTRVKLKDGDFYDVQEELIEVFDALQKCLSNYPV